MYTNSKDQMLMENLYEAVHSPTINEGIGSADIIPAIQATVTSLLTFLAARHLIKNRYKVAIIMDTILGNPETKAAIEKYRNLMSHEDKKHDMQNLIDAHNLKIQIVKLAGEKLFNMIHGDFSSDSAPTTYWERLKGLTDHFKKPFANAGEIPSKNG